MVKCYTNRFLQSQKADHFRINLNWNINPHMTYSQIIENTLLSRQSIFIFSNNRYSTVIADLHVFLICSVYITQIVVTELKIYS